MVLVFPVGRGLGGRAGATGVTPGRGRDPSVGYLEPTESTQHPFHQGEVRLGAGAARRPVHSHHTKPRHVPQQNTSDAKWDLEKRGDFGHRPWLLAQLGDRSMLHLEHVQLFATPGAGGHQGLDGQVEARLRPPAGPCVRPDRRGPGVGVDRVDLRRGRSIDRAGRPGRRRWRGGLLGFGPARATGGWRWWRGWCGHRGILQLHIDSASPAPPPSLRGPAGVEAERVHDVGERRCRRLSAFLMGSGTHGRTSPASTDVGVRAHQRPREPCSSARSSGVSSWPTRSTSRVIS